MEKFTTNISFTTGYGKPIEMNVTRDKYGDLSINWLQVGSTRYTGKQIRTVRREVVLLDYAAKYIDLHLELAEAFEEWENEFFNDEN